MNRQQKWMVVLIVASLFVLLACTCWPSGDGNGAPDQSSTTTRMTIYRSDDADQWQSWKDIQGDIDSSDTDIVITTCNNVPQWEGVRKAWIGPWDSQFLEFHAELSYEEFEAWCNQNPGDPFIIWSQPH